jgi:fatty acid-binding protein DegV
VQLKGKNEFVSLTKNYKTSMEKICGYIDRDEPSRKPTKIIIYVSNGVETAQRK